METLLSTSTGYILLISYGLFMFGLSYFYLKESKTQEVDKGVEVTNSGDTFFFTRDNFVGFEVITNNINGNVNWFDINDVEVSLNNARQNQIKADLGAAFLAILNA